MLNKLLVHVLHLSVYNQEKDEKGFIFFFVVKLVDQFPSTPSTINGRAENVVSSCEEQR